MLDSLLLLYEYTTGTIELYGVPVEVTFNLGVMYSSCVSLAAFNLRTVILSFSISDRPAH